MGREVRIPDGGPLKPDRGLTIPRFEILRLSLSKGSERRDVRGRWRAGLQRSDRAPSRARERESPGVRHDELRRLYGQSPRASPSTTQSHSLPVESRRERLREGQSNNPRKGSNIQTDSRE